MFQFPAFASQDLWIQSRDTCLTTGGLPHSEISGSKVVCYLPEAYRKLQRPSSPLAAKASTVYASSLDHITQNSTQAKQQLNTIQANSQQRKSNDTPKDTSHVSKSLALYERSTSLSTLLKSFNLSSSLQVPIKNRKQKISKDRLFPASCTGSTAYS